MISPKAVSRELGCTSTRRRLRPSGCLIADKSCKDARRSRVSRSRSEVSSLIRSNHGAVRQRRPVYRPRIPNRRESTFHMTVQQHRYYVAYEPDGRATPFCSGRHYRVKSPTDSPIGLYWAQRVVARAYASSYRRSSWRSSSVATPEIVPVIAPVTVKKMNLPGTTGATVMVNVTSLPDAFLKRPVPPVT